MQSTMSMTHEALGAAVPGLAEADIGMLVALGDGRIEYANPLAGDLLGDATLRMLPRGIEEYLERRAALRASAGAGAPAGGAERGGRAGGSGAGGAGGSGGTGGTGGTGGRMSRIFRVCDGIFPCGYKRSFASLYTCHHKRSG